MTEERTFGHDVLTFDPDESLLRGKIPLDKFLKTLINLDETKVQRINFSRNGYCNDAVLKLIQKHKKKDYINLTEVVLDGCMLLTDAGIRWLSDIIHGATKLEKIVLNGITNLADNELYLLAKNMGQNTEFYMNCTSLKYITDLEMNRVKVEGCPLLRESSLGPIKFGHVFIIPHKSMDTSICKVLEGKEEIKRQPFYQYSDRNTKDNEEEWKLKFTEVEYDHPLITPILHSTPVQVFIPFDKTANKADVKKHITDTVVKVISREPFIGDYRETKEIFEKASNPPFLYGTAEIKLRPLAHKKDVTTATYPVVDENGVEKGQIECSIEYCDIQGNSIPNQEPLKNPRYLNGQEAHIKVKINFVSGLQSELKSSFCKYIFYHAFNYYVKTEEKDGKSPFFEHSRIFYIRSFQQKLVKYLSDSNFFIEVWGRKKVDENVEFQPRTSESSEPVYQGCEFVVLGTGKSSGQEPEVKLTAEDFDSTLKQISDCIEKHERLYEYLDLNQQNEYASLFKTKEKIEEFCRHLDRIQYMSLDLSLDQSKEDFKKKAVELMDKHLYHSHRMKYHVSIQTRKHHLLMASNLITLVDYSSGVFCPEDKEMKFPGHKFLEHAKTLQSQGKIAILYVGHRLLLIEMELLVYLYEMLTDDKDMQPCQKICSAIGENSQVWKSDSMHKYFVVKAKTEVSMDLVMEILKEYFGLIQIPAFRQEPTDIQSVYTLTSALSPPPVSFEDFWKLESRKDFVNMRKEYRFIHPVCHTLFSAVLTTCTQYGKTILLTSTSAVFQIGCIQTAVFIETTGTGYKAIFVESRCYMPEKNIKPINKSTEANVKELTWNVYCIYTDIVDRILKQTRTAYIMYTDTPLGLVNISVGCRHYWRAASTRPGTTVCSLCHKCTDKGEDCPYNGIMGDYLRDCPCKTRIIGCARCGLCIRCVSKLWDNHTYLRPMAACPNVKLEEAVHDKKSKEENEELDEAVEEDNPFQDLADNFNEDRDDQVEEEVNFFVQVPLDPLAYNEFELQHIAQGRVAVALKEIYTGTSVSLFPGKPMLFVHEDIKDGESLIQKISNHGLDTAGYKFQFYAGDSMKVRITDPFRCLSVSTTAAESEFQESKVVYHTRINVGIRVSHETGLLCYELPERKNTSNTKGFFVGSKPFSKDLKTFSLKVINEGNTRFMGLGVSADKSLREPDEKQDNKVEHIKYHMNRGGVFTQSATKGMTEPANEGDILTVFCDVEEKILKFLKNDKEIFTTDIEIPTGGWFPHVTMHSLGECVQLLEKSPWQADPERVSDFPKPIAFDTFKYSSLWISPARTVTLGTLKIKKTDRSGERWMSGWMVLNNTSDTQLLYSIYPKVFLKKPVGVINPGEFQSLHIEHQVIPRHETPLETGLKIQWMTVEESKAWTEQEIKEMFEKTPSDKINLHRLNCMSKASVTGDSEVPLFNEAGLVKGENFKLEVFKNNERINAYMLKKGVYIANVYSLAKGKPAEYILKRIKSPSFLYPGTIEKGMKVIMPIENRKKDFAEAVVIDKDEGYCLECTPNVGGDKKKNKKEVLFCDEEVGVSDEDWKYKRGTASPKDIYSLHGFYPADSNYMEERPFIHAPPFLITKGSAELLDVMDPRWKRITLKKMNSCKVYNTRFTVQAENLAHLSKELLRWMVLENGAPLDSILMLPSTLDNMTLTYPKVSQIFTDLSIHRLCFVHEKFLNEILRQMAEERMKHITPQQRARIKSYYANFKKNRHYININDGKTETAHSLKTPKELTPHLMDIPGFTVQEVPVDVSFGCLHQNWTLVALLANKLLVPSYSQLLTDKSSSIDRNRVEHGIYDILLTYASLCNIYSLQHGGLSFQTMPENYTKKIEGLLKDIVVPMDDSKNMLQDSGKFRHVPTNFLACKAHDNSLFAQNLIVRQPEFSLDEQYYKPYSEHIDTLLVEGVHLNSLPNNLFQTFRNLQVLSIMDVPLAHMNEFPAGMSQCKDLEIFCLSGLKTMKKLPKDLLQGPSLKTVFFNNMPIRNLIVDRPNHSTITSLTLTGLLLEKVPGGIGELSNLKDLDLSYNPINTLPDQMKNLEKLESLSLKGIPWIEMKGETEIQKVMYDSWHEENPYIVSYLSQKRVDELFYEFDLNRNNMLEPVELAQLNLHIIMKVPRLGCKSLGVPGDCGVPPVLFQLRTLQKLDLSYTAITSIPERAQNWQQMKSIKLDHCPLLESVDGQLGFLPNLKNVRLSSCPSLDSPPQDIVGRGPGAIKAFLKRMAGGFTECHRTKLMFIGLGQAGKTTLLKALRSPLKKTSGSIDPELTDGIDIIPWVVPVEHNGRKIEITYSCWDFAGQTVYYNTHQFFLSKQAVYMLLWNMRMGFEHAGLDFWLSSVACHCPEAPVIIVGTQLDQIPMPDIPEDDLMAKYPQIKKFCYVSSTNGTNIKELESTLTDVTMNHCSQMSMKIPKVWLTFENGILAERAASKNIMNWKQLTQVAIDNGLYDDKDIRLAIEFLNDLGTVQYFDTEFLRDRVVINPQWIVDVMAKVVSVNEKSIKKHNGRFYHKFIKEIWKDYDPSLHNWMLKLTETFDLTFPLPDETEKINIVPCLLPESTPLNLPWPYLNEDEGFRESTILYKFAYLPTGLFNRAQARLYSEGFTEHSLLDYLWKKGSILKKNQHYALVRQLNDSEMIVSAQGPRPKNVLDLIHETLVTLITEAFQGVHYDYYIQCPDCVEKEGTKDPFLFKAELICRAYSVNAPFLQCTKFFHTVSIGELLRIMPDSKETEFDAQMQDSINTLEEISRNMTKDVAILCCPGDMPLLPMSPDTTPEQAEKYPTDPRAIYNDLKKAGFKCWFHENIDNVPDMEMIMALKNSKVLVVCLSEGFVQHEKCHKWFLYATEQLHQPFAVAVMDASQGWLQTDIGFKIGNPKMAMIKNMKRYPKKILDLVDIVRGQLENLEKLKQGAPPVFISYCWANSATACSITTEAKEGSIGYGDPRVIKSYLEKNGIKCWMDYEQMGKYGLYQDITKGLQNSKVLVICVSDEYIESDACMMEARFGVHNMYLPIVVCAVGTGTLWKESEISLMIKRQNELATLVKMQREIPGVYERVLAAVQNYLQRPETEKQRKVREKLERARLRKQMKEETENKITQQGDTEFSFQEEIELVQRKFMRYVTMLSQSDDSLMPRLLVVDFHDKLHKTAYKRFLFDSFKETNPDYARKLIEAIEEAHTGSTDKAKVESEKLLQEIANRMSEEKLRRKESKLSQFGIAQDDSRPNSQNRAPSSHDRVEKANLDRTILSILEEAMDDNWNVKDVSLRVLCEFEQGWHFYGATVELEQLTGKTNIMRIIKDSAPYLARVYEILKQSGVDLNCSSTQKGDSYFKFIQKEGSNNKSFAESYRALRRVIENFTESDDSWMSIFPRCVLPNGNTAYLCDKHMQQVSATKVSYDFDRGGHNRILLTELDQHLKDLLAENPVYIKMRREKSSLPISEKTSEVKDRKEVEKKEPSSKSNVKENDGRVVKESPNISQQEEATEVSRQDTSRQSSVSSTTSTTSNPRRQKSQRQTSSACSIQ